MLTTAPASQRVILPNISWETFEAILAEMGDKRVTRVAYDGKMLEIMTPLMPHEHNNRLLEHLVFALAEELSLNIKSIGSTTCKRKDIRRGVEPDSGFYIANEPLMRGKQTLDLTIDPPPDLVIEVDYTSSSLDRLPIYKALGVSEVWRYDEPVMLIYKLSEGEYIPCNDSPTFSNLPLTTQIPDFLTASLNIGEINMIREFRTWIKQQLQR
jgi:Uma2 family endonuclease